MAENWRTWDYFDRGDIFVLGTANTEAVAASSRLQIQQKRELEAVPAVHRLISLPPIQEWRNSVFKSQLP